MNTMILILLQILLVGLAVPSLRRNNFYQAVLAVLKLQHKKPMDCSQCLGMWTSLILHLCFWGTTPILACLAALGTATLSSEVDKAFDKF